MSTRTVLAASTHTSFEVVFKIQETCNLNCAYCYMYNVGNELHKFVPTAASSATCEAVAHFFCDQFKDRTPLYARLILHGGEPMLMPPHQFDRRMQVISSVIDARLSEAQRRTVEFCMQSNATLVTNTWIDCLEKWGIRVGVSIDGPQGVHDENRQDHERRGSHARTIEGISKLQAAAAGGRLKSKPGALCVINPEAKGADVFRYLTSELDFDRIDFLLPFMNWDTYSQRRADGVRHFLVDAFRVWLCDPQYGRKRVRIFDYVLSALRWGASDTQILQSGVLPNYVIIVESDGTIMPEESLRPTYRMRFGDRSVHRDSLSDILGDPAFQQSLRDGLMRADECADCALIDVCGSGSTLSRVGFKYSSSGPLRKPVYCEAFVDLFVEAAAALRSNNLINPKTLGWLERENLEDGVQFAG